MPTNNQLIKTKRKKKLKKNLIFHIQKCPQKSAVCKRTLVMTPRKPNSALRKVAWIALSTQKQVYAYIPGQGHDLGKNAKILVRGGPIKDLPGVKYTIIRGGKYDLKPLSQCKNARSKYGVVKIRNTKLRKSHYKKYRYW